MSYEFTLDVRGVRHGIERQIATRREPIDDHDPSSTRSYPACGGYVDAKPDRGFLVVTCVACVVAELRHIQLMCRWCKPPGSGNDSCEVNGRCMSCNGTGVAEGET